jgi:hypothetical protein
MKVVDRRVSPRYNVGFSVDILRDSPSYQPEKPVRQALSPVQRARLRSLRAEFEGELRNERFFPPIVPASPPKSPRRVKRPDSRPPSPVTYQSPGRPHRKGLYLGFGVTIVIKNLSGVVEDYERRSKACALKRLKERCTRIRAAYFFENLCSRKIINNKLHAISIFRRAIKQPHVSEVMKFQSSTILPLNTAPNQSHIPYLVMDMRRPSLATFAGLGKVCGVLLSIQRFDKLTGWSALRG